MKNKKVNLQLFGDAEDNAVDILKELGAEYEHMDAATQIEVAKLAQLKRIADVLEGINSTLIDMSAPIESLAECVDVSPARYGGREYTFLHIGGSVDAGV
ncbi:hypothetical protein B5F86_01605 [Lachnoclostridium sp. An298]|nr:hypothetical protein B5F86_01605 [Lachnoclostridium sp. An298]